MNWEPTDPSHKASSAVVSDDHSQMAAINSPLNFTYTDCEGDAAAGVFFHGIWD